MTDIMVDVETSGTEPGVHRIVSIGAVAFTTDSLGPELYRVVDKESTRAYGYEDDPDTLAWWAKQSIEVRRTFAQSDLGTTFRGAEDYTKTLTDCLLDLSSFIDSLSTDARIWGNGPDFDNAMLAHAYYKCGIWRPWKHYNSRCFRTLKALDPLTYENFARTGTYHNALDDAKHQARIAGAILAKMSSEDEGWGAK